ncbi:MAG: ABC transporter ATP-binding protein [Acidobacteriaceae bacterium]|nr:ABC transporter ATP-binding protein [Acidobacteriaceae bacterium]
MAGTSPQVTAEQNRVEAAEGRSDHPPSPAIWVHRLTKHYGAIRAVRGIDLEVKNGEIFGLIGPDGAGKTTTFQILAGVMQASGGQAEVFGRPAGETRSETGYLTQAFSLYPDLTVAENIRYIGDLRRVDRKDIEKRSHRYLQMFDMDRFRGRLAGKLSGGMKQKLALACALVPEPRVLLLDEPTTGVDPVSRREFWDTLAHLAAGGLTILIATPYLDEAERCHRVALMHEGAIQQTGTPTELRASLGATRLELHVENLAEAERVLVESRTSEQILDVQRFGDRLDVLVHDPARARADLEEDLKAANVEVTDVREDEPTLENVFVAKLRSLGLTIHEPTFPGRHGDREVRGLVAIGAKNLTRTFGDFTAVKNVNLDVKYGEIYGLLGANGAGKTTTIKMLCGLLEPSRGDVQLAGERGSRMRSGNVRQRVGYMSQKFSLYDDLSIKDNLDFFAGVYGVPAREREEKRKWVLSFSGLEGRQDQITGSLPGGWKQRVAFGAAIMHEPGVLFLDEPTSGVDPLARRAFWSMINRLADAGTAILVTTHYLEESEQCNRLGLMVAGELVVEGAPSGIKKEQKGRMLEFVVDQPQRAADVLKNEMEHWRVSLFGDRLHIITEEDAMAGEQSVKEILSRYGIRTNQVQEGRFSMEDVFIGVVQRAREQGKVALEE